MPNMRGAFHVINTGNLREYGQDLTPYSPVSSFNLPAQPNPALITPVCVTQSISASTRPASVSPKDVEIRHSPDSYDIFIFNDCNAQSPMKAKYPAGTLHLSTADSSFPPSPHGPPPFWGSYGVSATPMSGTSEASTSMNPSPVMQTLGSAGGTSNDSRRSAGPIAGSRSTGAPILIAPSPQILKRSATIDHESFRQTPLPSTSPTSSVAASSNTSFNKGRTSLSTRKGKRKSSRYKNTDLVLSGEMNFEEQILMDLAQVKKLPWKEVAEKFCEKTGKNMRVPALQMRRKRLVDRLRVWTPADSRALTLAVQDIQKPRWDQIAHTMTKYGCVEPWPKDMVERKWHEMRPDDDFLISEYDTTSRNQLQMNDDFGMESMDDVWSDGGASTGHSLHESETGPAMSTASTTTMDNRHSGQASDANTQFQVQQHHQRQQLQRQQQQMLFQQQQQMQHNPWAIGN